MLIYQTGLKPGLRDVCSVRGLPERSWRRHGYRVPIVKKESGTSGWQNPMATVLDNIVMFCGSGIVLSPYRDVYMSDTTRFVRFPLIATCLRPCAVALLVLQAACASLPENPTMEQLVDFANDGDTKAQTDLGRKYHLETREFDKAVYWYGKAAEAGDAKAQNNLGLMYQYGQGVQRAIPGRPHSSNSRQNRTCRRRNSIWPSCI